MSEQSKPNTVLVQIDGWTGGFILLVVFAILIGMHHHNEKQKAADRLNESFQRDIEYRRDLREAQGKLWSPNYER